MGYRGSIVYIVIFGFIILGSVFETNLIPVIESQLSTSIKITKLTTGGDDIFDFIVSGPTSFNANINTLGGDTELVEPTIAISSFQETHFQQGGVQFGDRFVHQDVLPFTQGAMGNPVILNGQKISRIAFEGLFFASTTGNVTAYIWSGISQNSTLEGNEIIVAQSDTWDFAVDGNIYPPLFINGERTLFNFTNPAPLTGNYVIGVKWYIDDLSCGTAQVFKEACAKGTEVNLSGGNSIFSPEYCTMTEIGTSGTWSSCHTQFENEPIRFLSMEIISQDDLPILTPGIGIEPTKLIVHHTFDPTEINNGISINAGTFGGSASGYFLTDTIIDSYQGDVYTSDFMLNSSSILGSAVIKEENKTVIQLGNLENRGQWNFLHNNDVENYTMSFWIKGDLDEPDPIPVINTLDSYIAFNGLSFGFHGGIPYLLIFSENSFSFDLQPPSFTTPRLFSDGYLPDDGNFHLVTLSIQKSNETSTAQACIDLICGTLDRDAPFSNECGTFSNCYADRPLTIGEDNLSRVLPAPTFLVPRAFTEFQIDDLCIWQDYLLTASDRNELFNSGSGQSCASVVPVGGNGIGNYGPTQVNPGTYSVQETIPAGWTLTTASCNDGSSSFSVDTVSGIQIDSGDNIVCTFENEFGVLNPDTDGDGIYNEVDTLPNTFSDNFSDIPIGGISSGTITARGNQILTITEEANPTGVRIIADISGGLIPATVTACGGISILTLNPGDNVVLTCGSITIDVINGPVEITFISSGGTQGTTSISSGNSITFDQDKFSFVSPSTNTQTIIIDVNGSPITINPGDTNTSEPQVGSITASLEPIQIGTLVEASATFTDLGPLETHTAVFDWGDSTTSLGSVIENGLSGTVTGSHTYSTPGVYTVTLTVTDDTGNSGSSVFRFIVIYDSQGGFVTGGGWINSPTGAYVQDSSLVGKASFGFVSKYTQGVNVPTGNTQFSFQIADLKFKSASYEWLVVSGSNAKFKGTGSINGQGNYGFQLFGFDADVNTNDNKFYDKFRIKIWDKNNGDIVVYDNNIGVSENVEPSTILGGGSIKIHQP